ncbi:MAG TPA: patatin-like phospholipase family protein [Anaerolineae bacterium]|nr:patatin-like phospholipase family protein [Anaerolineae bacterium]
MDAGAKQDKRVLVLSGGGGRGAYHVGVLEYLEQVGWRPDVIVGSSVGAVNAAALGSGVPVRGLKSRWLDLATEDVQKMRVDDVLLDNLLRRRDHVFDLTPWPETLMGRSRKWEGRAWFNPDVVNSPDAPYQVHVTAVNARSARLEFFTNRVGNSPEHCSGLRLEHVLASFSIPLWYGPTDVDGVPYWDGGTLANTPFRRALELGATEIVVATMVPWPERPLYNYQRPGYIQEIEPELLVVAQELWNAFEPALDAMLTETVWRDYLLYKAELEAGCYPDLKWLEIVAPDHYLTVGLMTHYQLEYHKHLMELGYWDAKKDLATVLPLGDS